MLGRGARKTIVRPGAQSVAFDAQSAGLLIRGSSPDDTLHHPDTTGCARSDGNKRALSLFGRNLERTRFLNEEACAVCATLARPPPAIPASASPAISTQLSAAFVTITPATRTHPCQDRLAGLGQPSPQADPGWNGPLGPPVILPQPGAGTGSPFPCAHIRVDSRLSSPNKPPPATLPLPSCQAAAIPLKEPPAGKKEPVEQQGPRW
jgi:hypothetical protein